MYSTRMAIEQDDAKLLTLYRKVAAISGGIARSVEEITPGYIRSCMDHSKATGIQMVVENPEAPGNIVGEMHAWKLQPRVFDHVLSELTIAVDPELHGKGIGRLLFTSFLEYIMEHRPDILRVELVTQESNERALNLYRSVGFVSEGRMDRRIRMYQNRLDADIPMAWYNPRYREPESF